MFKDITFGMAAAENEKSDLPDLLIHGFLDSSGHIDSIVKRNKFLVYGPKGSGKSAIGSRIELLSKERGIFYAKQLLLNKFDYNTFYELIPVSDEHNIKYPAGWEFLLSIALLDSYRKDPEFAHYTLDNLGNIVKILEEVKLLPNEQLGQIVKTASKKEFRGNLGIISAKYSTDGCKITDIKALYEATKNNIYSFCPKKGHIIIIDGLDSVAFKRERLLEAIAALLNTADDMNRVFREKKIPSKIVILCRTEILDRLADSNINKIKRDYGLKLEWYEGETNIETSNLYRLVNLRASVSIGRDIDVFKEYFSGIKLGKLPTPTVKFLFDHTRHTPRDIIQLMNSIKEHTHNASPTGEEIWNGIKSYSSEYFYTEIHDELAAFMDPKDIQTILGLLGGIRYTPFTLEDVKKLATERNVKNINIEDLLTMLYDSGAIGNLDDAGNLSFKYRNRLSIIDLSKKIVFHRGLIKAMNVPYKNKK